ncbi:hypothetical protein [Listeria booriae]|uniref:hypothetical protein n=1 Tax=Listeria booriae TaxID=1552123 RepID=UPI00162611ED|nr:hypothetical protein [Listeria booriae]MBC2163701.1 hypothetical protein [Listeria booriae]MBC2169647.1 hypothetical protein [Listeria booriae]MBC2194306.1 hypothetical protein [Listeria booriae]
MDKWLFNLSIFISAALLVVGSLQSQFLLTGLALVFAIMAQHFYRKKYPKRNRSFKELLEEREALRQK